MFKVIIFFSFFVNKQATYFILLLINVFMSKNNYKYNITIINIKEK